MLIGKFFVPKLLLNIFVTIYSVINMNIFKQAG